MSTPPGTVPVRPSLASELSAKDRRRRSSHHSRLHLPAHPEDPPIPPRLVGSTLMRDMTVRPDEPHRVSWMARPEQWLDGDEFGSRLENIQSVSPTHGYSRSSSIVGTYQTRRTLRPAPLSVQSMPPPTVPAFAVAAPRATRPALLAQIETQLAALNLILPHALTLEEKFNMWDDNESVIFTTDIADAAIEIHNIRRPMTV